MESQSKRDNSWLNATPHVGSYVGPAKYETAHVGLKESFNYGKVPFGSATK